MRVDAAVLRGLSRQEICSSGYVVHTLEAALWCLLRAGDFRACLMEIGDVFLHPEELERRYTRYLMAGDYRGGAFLNAVLISEGLVLLARYDGETSGTRFFTAKTGANCLAKPCGAILARST